MRNTHKLSCCVECYYVHVYRINRNNQMVKINDVLMAAILNFRGLFGLKCMTL